MTRWQQVIAFAASALVIACLTLQALQTFVFAPLAGAQGPYLLVMLSIFLLGASIAVLSFFDVRRLAALGALLYASLFSWVWWHFICKGTFVQSDFKWLELPALLLAACVGIRSIPSSPATTDH